MTYLSWSPFTLLVFSLCAGAACGDAQTMIAPPQPPPMSLPGFVDGAVGGTRLQAVFAQAADGTDQFLNWRDRTLDVSCTFDTLDDHQIRCRPSGPDGAEIDPAVSDGLYGDARCAQPVAELTQASDEPPSCATPRFAVRHSNTCEGVVTSYRVGRPINRQIYRQGSEGCQAIPPPHSERSLGVFEVDRLAPTELVAASPVLGTDIGGIVPVYLVATDGARMFKAFRDVASGADCLPRLTFDDERCLPVSAELIYFTFADPACTRPAAMASTVCGASIPHATDNNGFLSDKWTIYEGGPRIPLIYYGGVGQCSASAISGGGFSVGAEIPPSRFATGTWDAIPRGLGLVQPLVRAGGWTHLGSSALRSSTFFGFECALAPTSDGVIRCVPPPMPVPEESWRLFFADDRCTQAVVANEVDPLSLWDRTACPAQVRVYAREQIHDGDVYKKDAAGQCTFVGPPPNRSARSEYYRYADELAPERFTALSTVVR